jgi:hypothetical protein
MAEHVCDRLEGVAISEKLDRERVANDAGALMPRLDACLLQVAADEVAHDASPAECSRSASCSASGTQTGIRSPLR